MQGEAVFGRIGARVLQRGVGVVVDTEAEIQTVGLVPLAREHVPQREGVLAARHRHQHPVGRFEHVMGVDGAADLLLTVVQEVIPTERGVVATDVDGRGRGTPGTSRCAARDHRADLDAGHRRRAECRG